MTTHATSREIAAPVDQVFAAFTDPERLARWWGPAGFTNTFEICEFRTGGQWKYVMHGPDGHRFPNESEFEVVEPPGKVVIRHVSEPKYRLTITLAPSAMGTIVSWSQAFDNERVGSRLERIVVPGNEQNLDRLTDEVERASRVTRAGCRTS
jgi:uncharacterized protein YndB with AHSA1/START domain